MRKLILSFFKKKGIAPKKQDFIYDLIVFDDLYPHPGSGFRLEELSYLLKNVTNSQAVVSGISYQNFNLPDDLHQLHIDGLIKENIDLTGKIVKPHGSININCRLFYCIFLNNIYQNLDWLEKYKIPFAFTLYPGGGFLIDDVEITQKLKKVFSSKYFKKVIVTQQKTYNYLLQNNFCKQEDILFIFGVVVPQVSFINDVVKSYYGKHKDSFDICFFAAKTSPLGENKGYPLFVEFMKIIAPKYKFVRFHIIGGFDETVIDVTQIEDKITFYGYQEYSALKKIFSAVDLIISPNVPDKLGKGSFDGFPLGTVIEAALNEVVVMLTDSFNENNYFEDGEKLIIIQPNLQDIVEKFETSVNDLSRFYSIAKNGKTKFQHIYSNDFQMKPRLDMIQSLIDSSSLK
jgi:glycosyltransferase involved in cell wall biosynthesis